MVQAVLVESFSICSSDFTHLLLLRAALSCLKGFSASRVTVFGNMELFSHWNAHNLQRRIHYCDIGCALKLEAVREWKG